MQPAPVVLTPRERMEDALVVLTGTANRIGNMINECVNIYRETSGTPSHAQEVLINNVQLFAIVQFSAFLEEYEKRFLTLRADNIEAARITKVDTIVQPALDVVKSYSGMRDMRNWLLAHTRVDLRLRRDNMYLNPWRGGVIATLITPVTISEFMLVARSISRIAEYVAEEFPEYYTEPLDFIAQYTTPNTHPQKTNAECLALDTSTLAAMEQLKLANS